MRFIHYALIVLLSPAYVPGYIVGFVCRWAAIGFRDATSQFNHRF